jgi:hypothetical protein
MRHEQYGGAPLLGVSGAVVKAHGSSNAVACDERYPAGPADDRGRRGRLIASVVSALADAEN